MWTLIGLGDYVPAVDVDDADSRCGNSHMLDTDALPGTGSYAGAHGAVISDEKTPLNSDGTPLCAPVWRYLCCSQAVARPHRRTFDLAQCRAGVRAAHFECPGCRGIGMDSEHHRDLAHEFPELKHRVHELKLASRAFRSLYEQYQVLDNEIRRIEQEIETPSDEYTEELKRRRVHLKDRLYGMLTGRIPIEAGTEEYVTRHKFRLPVDHGEVVRDWIQRDYSCGAFADPPGQEWRDYVHDTNELVTVVDGRLEVVMHGESYVLEPGDELYIPRRTAHRVRNVHHDTTRWLYGYD